MKRKEYVMRWIMFPLMVAVVLSSPVPSQAQAYRERRGELLTEFIWPLPRFLDEVMPKILAQFDKRDKALSEARKLLQDTSTSSRDNNSKWVEFHQKQATEQLKAFNDLFNQTRELIEEEPLTPEEIAHLLKAVPKWVLGIGGQVAAFHQQAKAMPLAKLRDTLISHQVRYEEEHDSLEDKLDSLESTDNGFDSSANSYRNSLKAACLSMSSAVKDSERSFSGLVRDEVRKDTDLAGARRFRDRLEDEVDDLVTILERFERAVDDNLGRITDVFNRERNVIRMFGQTRTSVANFESEINYEKASTTFTASHQVAKTLAGKMEKSGDKKDLEAYVEHAMADLKTHRDNFKGDYESFVSDFEGNFLRRLDSATIELFIENGLWTSWARDIDSCDPPAVLDNAWDRVRQRWDAPVGTVTDQAARREIEDALSDAISELTGAFGTANAAARRLEKLAELRERQALEDALGN